MMNLIIVPSVINVVNKPLSYCDRRSSFTSEQRYEQTLLQLETIRKKVPNSYISFVEASPISEEMENNLRAKVDYYFNVSEIPEVPEATNSPAKGYGEAMQLISYLHSEHFKEIRKHCTTVSKFGGRIRFTDDFVFVVPDMPRIHVEFVDPQPRYMNTVFYTMPETDVDSYMESLQECILEKDFLEGKDHASIEHMLYKTWFGKGKSYIHVDYIGVEGFNAPSGFYYRV